MTPQQMRRNPPTLSFQETARIFDQILQRALVIHTYFDEKKLELISSLFTNRL